jgi:hypothetical protein
VREGMRQKRSEAREGKRDTSDSKSQIEITPLHSLPWLFFYIQKVTDFRYKKA